MMIQHSFNDNNNISLDKFVPNIKFGLELVDDVSIFDQRYFIEMSYFLYNVIKVKMFKRYSSKIKKIYVIKICSLKVDIVIISNKINSKIIDPNHLYILIYKKKIYYRFKNVLFLCKNIFKILLEKKIYSKP